MSDRSILERLMIGSNVNTELLKGKYKNTSKETVMNTIFDRLDVLDRYTELKGELDFGNNDRLKTNGSIEFSYNSGISIMGGSSERISELRYNVKHYLMENEELSEEKIKKVFGNDVSVQDVENALTDLLGVSEAQMDAEWKEKRAKVDAKFSDIPDNIRESIDENDKVKVYEKNGQKYYEVDKDGDGDQFFTYNSAGVIVKTEEKMGIQKHDGPEHQVKRTQYFNEDGSEGQGDWGSIGEKLEYDNGLVEMTDWNNMREKQIFGKNQFEYSIDPNNEYKRTLKNITLNEGLSNQTKMNFKYDSNGKISDINFDIENQPSKLPLGDNRDLTIKKPPINMTQKQKQNLIDILNSGAELGDDFELKVNGDKIEINPIIKDKNGKYLDNIPDTFRQDVVDLMKQGLHAGSDYDLSVDENGNYQIDFQSQKAKEYDGDEKIVKVSRDGKTKTTMTTNGNEVKIDTSHNGKKVSSTVKNRDEALMENLLDGKFQDAYNLLGDIDYEVNNFDFYAICKKYQDITGKNLMKEVIKQYKDGKVDGDMIRRLTPTLYWPFYGDNIVTEFAQEEYDRNLELFNEIKNFDPSKSQVSHMLPKIGQKENVSKDKYNQTINNKNYSVEKTGNSINVSCDGTTKSIDLSKVHPKLQQTIFESSPIVLFRIATQGISLEMVYDEKATQNGGYAPEDNAILMNIGRVSNDYFKKCLAHETGHSYYTQPKNEINEKFEASFKQEKAEWEKAEDKFKDGNHSYCADSSVEFFAEAYALLTTGHSKSEYTLCKYFPKTLTIVKEIVEQE